MRAPKTSMFLGKTSMRARKTSMLLAKTWMRAPKTPMRLAKTSMFLSSARQMRGPLEGKILRGWAFFSLPWFRLVVLIPRRTVVK
jgi:hypothetical protein